MLLNLCNFFSKIILILPFSLREILITLPLLLIEAPFVDLISYFDKTFDVKVSNEIKNGVFDIYIYAIDENNNTDICLNFNSNTIVDFKAFLENVKSKYIEWKNIAIANNVSDMTKEMDFKTPSCTACWYWVDEWYFSFGVKLRPTFMILDDGMMVVMLVKEFTASDNRYITNTMYMVWGDAFNTHGEGDSSVWRDYTKNNGNTKPICNAVPNQMNPNHLKHIMIDRRKSNRRFLGTDRLHIHKSNSHGP